MHAHDIYMRIALKEAWKAFDLGEVPVGALIIDSEGTVLGKAHNETITRNDPAAHAEMLALSEAAATIRNYRLLNTKMYVTLEPCIMCAGALVHARVEEVIYGASDPKWGGVTSLYRICEDERLNHRLNVTSGVLESDCAEVIKRFFAERREEQEDSLPEVFILD